MLSRLLTSAKSIFNSTSQTNSQQSRESTAVSEEMVTTRQKGKIAVIDLDAEDTITVETPRSSRKRQRESGDGDGTVDDTVAVGSASKKKKILPVRAKDEESPTTNTRLVVEIPVSKMADTLKENTISSPKSTIEPSKAREIIEIEDSEESDEDLEGSGLGSGDESEAPEAEQITPKAKTMTKAEAQAQAQALATPKRKQQVVAPSSATMPVVTPKHKRFGSEEAEVEFFSTAVEKIEPEEESSDDDEAPEVVETQAAQKSIELKSREAARAIEEQEAASREKRKAREEVLKKQAQAASKKRKRDDAEETKDPKAVPTNTEASTTPLKFKIGDPLPALLPDEYLQDTAPSALSDSNIDLPIAKPKKTKFTNLVDKRPKDRRKGSTTYRVAEVSNMKLTPKASFNARSTREAWLKGRTGKGVGTERKPFKSGLFVGK